MADTWGIHNAGAILTSHLNPNQMKLLIGLGSVGETIVTNLKFVQRRPGDTFLLPNRQFVRSLLWALSPFKDEDTPSFSVRKETNSFYDFSSGIGGNVLTFVRYYDKCGYAEAIEKLKKFSGFDGTPVWGMCCLACS